MLRFLAILGLMAPFCAVANPSSYDREEAQIPKSPSQPPALMQRAPKHIPHCERYFLFQGKREECDSNLGKDGQRLRTLMKDVPSAIAELDRYQDNLKNLRNAAYFGTAGLLAIVVGIVMSRPPFEQGSGTPKPGAYVMMVGLGVSINSMIYALSLSKTNETHLNNAVNAYNAAYPDRAIELQFSTQINF
jgi:hypothetical protein